MWNVTVLAFVGVLVSSVSFVSTSSLPSHGKDDTSVSITLFTHATGAASLSASGSCLVKTI